MAILVIAEQNGGQLYAGILNTITAAGQLGGDVDVLLASADGERLSSEIASIIGVRKILSINAAHYRYPVTEDIASLARANAAGYTHILAPATTFGKAVIPYLAALLDVQPISDISGIVNEDAFIRPIYAGNVLATVQSTDAVKLLTVRTTSFEVAPAQGGSAEVQMIDDVPATEWVEFVEQTLSSSERPELTSARIVVSGGRGMKSAENFAILEKLADTLGGAVGASRAAVDAGYVANEYQVGQTGKVVAPDVYIAVGISGAIQHLAGMKDSKVIVAINNDEEAPIFQVADYGWCEDLFVAVPAIQSELDNQ